MKKIILTLLVFLTGILLFAQKPITINGRIDNCPNRGNAYIEKRWFNPETLQEESISTAFKIAEDGSFSVRISNADKYFHRYWIYLGNEFTHLDLMAGDSINMELDAVYFDESINYTGNGAGRNNYRRDVFLTFWNDEAMSFVHQNNAIQFLLGLNAFTERRLQLLELYYKAGEIDLTYYETEKTLINNDKAELLLSNYHLFERFKSRPYTVAFQIKSILDGVNLSDEHFMQHSQFRNLVEIMPYYMLECRSNNPMNNMKQEIEYAGKNYPDVMQLYFYKKLMHLCILQDNRLSDNTELLNFFEKKFDEPVLKKEIMFLKYRCKEFKRIEF